MTLSIERDDRRMGLASDRTVYSSKRNRPLLLYGRLLDDSRPSHEQSSPYRTFADDPPRTLFFASYIPFLNPDVSDAEVRLAGSRLHHAGVGSPDPQPVQEWTRWPATRPRSQNDSWCALSSALFRRVKVPLALK